MYLSSVGQKNGQEEQETHHEMFRMREDIGMDERDIIETATSCSGIEVFFRCSIILSCLLHGQGILEQDIPHYLAPL